MKTFVITGSSRGIGNGLARRFLERGHQVMVSGSSSASTDKAFGELSEFEDRVAGHPCDVTEHDQVQALWDRTTERFGRIDVWINNAGINAAQQPFWEIPVGELQDIVNVDLMGVVFGCRVAMRGMIAQGDGHIYNMEGFGSGNEQRAGLTLYGATKRAVRYLSKAMLKDVGELPVKVSTLSPGIVVTDFLLKSSQSPSWPQARKILNILADRPEVVTTYLAERVLENDRSGSSIAWLTGPKIMWRFMTSPLRSRDLFSDRGM